MTGINSMKGKRAIVTGGGTGLGAATAVGLARRGVNVCINYNSSADAAEEVVAECRELGVEAFAVKANVAEDADCRKIADRHTACDECADLGADAGAGDGTHRDGVFLQHLEDANMRQTRCAATTQRQHQAGPFRGFSATGVHA
mgnify:CR=1 FL=1